MKIFPKPRIVEKPKLVKYFRNLKTGFFKKKDKLKEWNKLLQKSAIRKKKSN